MGKPASPANRFFLGISLQKCVFFGEKSALNLRYKFLNLYRRMSLNAKQFVSFFAEKSFVCINDFLREWRAQRRNLRFIEGIGLNRQIQI